MQGYVIPFAEEKNIVDKILEDSQGFYLLRFDGEKVLIILQNPIINSETFGRHNLQFIEINLNGKINYHNAGYIGVIGELEEIVKQKDDTWIFDEKAEIRRPGKHIAYNEKKKVKFTKARFSALF